MMYINHPKDYDTSRGLSPSVGALNSGPGVVILLSPTVTFTWLQSGRRLTTQWANGTYNNIECRRKVFSGADTIAIVKDGISEM
jgi:hypothetical protein